MSEVHIRPFHITSLISDSGAVDVYLVKDYHGNITFSHRIQQPSSSQGEITQLAYSPDGYALFVASQKGWYLWSVYGALLASSFTHDAAVPSTPTANGIRNPEEYMNGVLQCCWASNGLSITTITGGSRLLYSLHLARSAITTCYNPVYLR